MIKKSIRGFRKLHTEKPLTTESIKEYFLKIFEEKSKNTPWKGITYHTGFWEDGTEYEYWNINGMITGRGGYEMFCKALKEQCKLYE